MLTGHTVKSGPDAVRAARECADRWGCSVVLKGGHAEGPEAGDVVVHQGHCLLLSSPRAPIAGNSDHGTGCTFSSALAAQLALGTDWHEALIRAKTFVLASLTRPVRLSDRAAGMFPPEEELSVFRHQITYREIES